MRIIKVSATNSTNSFAKEMFRNGQNSNCICVVATEQTSGRGQRGSTWQSNAGENLTFSIVYPKLRVKPENQFLISAVVANSVHEALHKFGIKNLSIKWPNDILAGNKKIGGILIENFMGNGSITTSIIGIGLNINQQSFEGLAQASSLSIITGKQYNLDQLLRIITEHLELNLDLLTGGVSTDRIMGKYHDHLFKIGIPSTFQIPDGPFFMGIIKGVARSGKLRVQVEDEEIKEFDIKEVKLCY